jgi:AraC-type transcriptional regulator N-terminus
MTNDLAPHLDIALRHAPRALTVNQPIPRLELCVGQTSTGKAPCLYRSMICFILQGSKRVAINDNLLSYDSAQYLISALDLPLIGQILDAGAGQPYVAVSLVLEPALLAELAAIMPPLRENDHEGIGIAINPMTASLRDTLLRLLSLLDNPNDIPVLAPWSNGNCSIVSCKVRRDGCCGRSPSPMVRWVASDGPFSGSGTITTLNCASRHYAMQAA